MRNTYLHWVMKSERKDKKVFRSIIITALIVILAGRSGHGNDNYKILLQKVWSR